MPLSFRKSGSCRNSGAGNPARSRLKGGAWGVDAARQAEKSPSESRRQALIAAPLRKLSGIALQRAASTIPSLPQRFDLFCSASSNNSERNSSVSSRLPARALRLPVSDPESPGLRESQRPQSPSKGVWFRVARSDTSVNVEVAESARFSFAAKAAAAAKDERTTPNARSRHQSMWRLCTFLQVFRQTHGL